MITLPELQSEVRQSLYSFVDCVVNFETVEDDPRMVGVGVYGVKKGLVNAVENKILDLDSKLCATGEFTLIPLVQDQETTELYYPQFSKGWQPTEPSAAWVVRSDTAPIEFLTEFEVVTDWACRDDSIQSAANKELALAA